MQHVHVIRSSVRVLECVFRHVSCVMATHSVVTTVTKSTVLTITVSFSSNFHVNLNVFITCKNALSCSKIHSTNSISIDSYSHRVCGSTF